MQDLVPLLVAVLILALLLGLVLFVSHVQPAKVLVVAAARNCARAGVESLSEGRGLNQALQTAVETAAAGTAIDPEGLMVRAYVEGGLWRRGRVLVCETGYNVPVSHLPMVSWYYTDGYVPLRARVALSIEPYKSRWAEP